MKGKRRERAFLGKACGLGLLLILTAACADNGIPIKDLRGQIQGGSKRNVELVFATKEKVVALIDNRRGALYAATAIGDIFRIDGVNKAERLCRGLVPCKDSWTAFALTKDGQLVTGVGRDDRDVLVTVSDKGEVKDLTPVNGHIIALANDSRGTLYVAVWQSEGNVSISLNPTALAGAEFIVGKIFQKDPDGPLTQIYDGSIPVWIGVSRRDNFYASLWGQKGYFAPEKKTYSYVDPYRAYWLALGDRVQFMNFKEGKTKFDSSLINSLSLFLIPEDNYLLGYGLTKQGDGGLYLIEENRPPIKLLLQEQKFDKNITSLALYDNVVYFGNADGNVYRIK
jgi:hypothetical protein